MAEMNSIIFNYKEVVEALIKQQGIHEGIWALYVEFGLTAANVGVDDSGNNFAPAAIVPLQKFGIIRADKVSNISVDAAEVNPKPKQTSKQNKK